MKAKIVLTAFALSLQAQQIITTYAGTEWVFPSVARQALSAPLSSQLNTAVDNQGRMIISDGLNHVISRVSTSGELTVIAGNGVAGYSGDGGDARVASLNSPQAVVFDQAGNMYVSDLGNRRVRKVSPAGTITTIAGNGFSEHSGDGGPAISAGMYPLAIAVDRSNAILIADNSNNRLRRVTPDGRITTIAGTGERRFSGEGRPAGEASLAPGAVDVDQTGRILIADSENHRIFRIGSDNILRTIAGTGVSGFSGDGGPATAAQIEETFDLTVDGAGNIILADTNNRRIRRITANGVISTIAGGGESQVGTAPVASMDAHIGFPASVAVDPAGRIHIADIENQFILTLSADATAVAKVAGNGLFKAIVPGTPAQLVNLTEPTGVAIAPDGSIYFAEFAGNRIGRIDSRGQVTIVAGNGVASCCNDDGPAAQGLLSGPNSLAFAPDGALILVDGGSQKIRRIFQGTISTIAGSTFTDGFSGDNGPAKDALLRNPWGVAIDRAGNIYFADRGNHRIRRIDTRGVITTIAGNGRAGFSGDGGQATAASLDTPHALAFLPNGDLLIADYWNNRIRAVSPAGTIRTFAGNGSFEYGGDGGAATAAGLNGPYALAVDGAGNVYVGHDFSLIRRIAANNIISTIAGQNYDAFEGDGGSPAGAALNAPTGLAVDSAGNIFIADSGNDRIRVIRNLTLTTTLAPSSINLTGVAGAATSLPARLAVTSSIAGIPFTSSVSYGQAQANWLTVEASGTNAPATLTLTANASALPPGRYTATVTVVTNPASAANPVQVVLTVSEVPARLTLSSESMTFSTNAGAAAAVSPLEIRNEGGGTLNFQATVVTSGAQGWLRVSPSSGSLRAGQTVTANVVADPSGLNGGTYNGSITVTAGSMRAVVPVTLTVRAQRPTLLISQVGLTFTGVAGGGDPTPQKLGILNIGAGTLAWRAAAAKGNFVRLGAASGVVNTPWLEVSELPVSVSIAGYPAGQYYDQIQISGDAGNSPQLVTVLMNILPEGSNPGPDVTPSGMMFLTRAGENPGSQTITFNHLGSGGVTYASSRLGTWYEAAPSNGRATPNSPAKIVIQPTLNSLAPGAYRGVVTFQGEEDGSVRNVSLLAVVAPRDAGAKEARGAGSCAAPTLRVEATALRNGFNVRAGEAVTVEVKSADECGNALTPLAGGTGASVVARPDNGDPQFSLAHVGGGVWQGTWRPVRPTTNTRMTIVAAWFGTAADVIAGRSQYGKVELNGSVLAQGANAAPLFSASGVVHAASLEGGVPIAPGSLISLFGTKLADASGSAPGIPLPSNLNGTEVRLGNRSLPLLYTSDGQLNAQVPYDVSVDTQHQISVNRGEIIAVPETLTVSAAQPGIFTKSQTGSGQGAIVKQDGVTLAEPGTPAARGEVVIIYCSGLGPVNPAVEAGQAAPGSPLSHAVNPVTVTIGGQNAQVLFAGLAPTFSGLYQVNAIVPAGSTTGDTVEVTIEAAGQRSRPVTIAVR